VGLALFALPLIFWRNKEQSGFEIEDCRHWAQVDHLEMVNSLAVQLVVLLFSGFLISNVFRMPDGLQLKDSPDWICLAVSFILFIAASGYAIKIFLPWFRGRACRLKLIAPSYRVGEPVRMILCVGHPLPEGGEAVLTLRCQRPRMEEERGFRIHVTLFEKKKHVQCPTWAVSGEDLEIPLEFDIPETLPPSDLNPKKRNGIRWIISAQIETAKARYQRAFVIPLKR
jgi:hypothetical protein